MHAPVAALLLTPWDSKRFFKKEWKSTFREEWSYAEWDVVRGAAILGDIIQDRPSAILDHIYSCPKKCSHTLDQIAEGVRRQVS